VKFNEIIKNLREDKEPKLTQKAVAEALMTSQRKISRLETGETEPSIEDLKRPCRFYNVSADYLLNLPDDLPYPKRQK